MRCFLVPMLVLSFLLLGAGCEEPKGLQIGDLAPEVSDLDIHGNSVSLSRLKGRIVLICFWTDSCCGESLKRLETLYCRHQSRGLEILAINELNSKQEVAAFASRNRLTFAMLTDADSVLFKRYQVRGFPTFFLLDGRGMVRQKILGELPRAKIEQLVQRQFEIQKKAEESYEKIHAR